MILGRDTETSIKDTTEKEIWVESTIVWEELNGVKVLSRVKSETFGLRKCLFMNWDEDKWERFLVVNKLIDRELKMGENQLIRFSKLGADGRENNDRDDKNWGDK